MVAGTPSVRPRRAMTLSGVSTNRLRAMVWSAALSRIQVTVTPSPMVRVWV
jgi:hypothetical protein